MDFEIKTSAYHIVFNGTISSEYDMFDFDGTLARTKNGTPFARHIWDVQKLHARVALPQQFVIFSNQRCRWKIDQIKNFVNEHAPPGAVYVIAVAYAKYLKKPSRLLFDIIHAVIQQMPRMYIGDALGRPGDFAASDAEFAFEIGVPFIGPEEYFDIQ